MLFCRDVRHRVRIFFVLVFAGGLLLAAGGVVPAAEDSHGPEPLRVLYLQLEGPVTPAQADLLDEGIHAATTQGAKVLLLRLDTPGGLVDSMRDMVKSMLNAPIPVAVWVGPSGAHAASAGVFLVAASNIAAMAPQTTIGAASPVDIQGGNVPETMARKVKNDLMGLLRGVTRAKGRNLDWYERSVEDAVSATAQEAVMERVVEFVAKNPQDFLAQAGSRGIGFHGTVLHFSVDQVEMITHEPGMRYRFLSWLLHPQIAYILLLGGMAGLFFELVTPGVVLPGVLGGLSLLLGLYALSVLPTNAAGVLLILFALVLFLMELKITSYGLLAVAGIVAMFVGSLLLIKPGQGFEQLPLRMVVVTVGGVAVLVGGCLFFMMRSMVKPPATGREAMAGAPVEVRQWQGRAGQVFCQGALWSAYSRQPLVFAKGEKARIIGIDGLKLEIEPQRDSVSTADAVLDSKE